MKKMNDIQTIEKLISEDKLDEAIALATENMNVEPNNAMWAFLRGKAYWRKGDKRMAISDYENASQLDPTSPATAALEMSRDVMDFYNPDLLNP